jgi:hypothetical protein
MPASKTCQKCGLPCNLIENAKILVLLMLGGNYLNEKGEEINVILRIIYRESVPLHLTL